MKFLDTISNLYTQVTTQANNAYIKARNWISPGSLSSYQELDTTSASQADIAQKAKAAYQTLLDPHTNEIDPSKVEKQLQATRYLLNYLNWVIENAQDEEKKKRAVALKLSLTEIYNRKKWVNRAGEFYSWIYGLMQGLAIAGYWAMLCGISTMAAFKVGTGSFAILMGALAFLIIAGLRNYYLTKKDNPRLMLWAYNRKDQPPTSNVNQQTKTQLAISALMSIVGAAVWFGLVFFGSYEFLLAIDEMIVNDGGKSLGALVWQLPLGLTAFTIFIPELVLNFEGNKDFISDYVANRKTKGIIASLGATDEFWKELTTKYGVEGPQLEKIQKDFIKNTICVCIGMFGITLIGLAALKALYGGGALGMALSALTLVVGTICQIAFYRARSKDQAVDDAKQAFAAAQSVSTSGADAKDNIAEDKKPNSLSTNVQRCINAMGAAIPAGLGMYGAGGMDFISMSFWTKVGGMGSTAGAGAVFAVLGISALIVTFLYLAFRNSLTATAAGSPDMLPIRTMAEEIEKPAQGEVELVEQVKQQPELYTVCWGNSCNRGVSPNLGRNYVTEADIEDDIDYVEGTRMAAAR